MVPMENSCHKEHTCEKTTKFAGVRLNFDPIEFRPVGS